MTRIGLMLLLIMGWAVAENELEHPNLKKHPYETVSNRFFQIHFFKPDQKKGFYRSWKYDWSGMFDEISIDGQAFFTSKRWPHDPLRSGHASGMVSEFSPTGYEEAGVDQTFIKVGVGRFIRKTSEPFHRGHSYEISDHGQWQTIVGSDWIQHEQRLPLKEGWAYVYRKRITLLKDKPGFVVHCVLLNEGLKTINTELSQGPLVRINHRAIDQAYRLSFPFDYQFIQKDTLFRKRKDKIYLKEAPKSIKKMVISGPKVPGNRFLSVENLNVPVLLKYKYSLPFHSIRVEAEEQALSPLFLSKISVEPNRQMSWSMTCEFLPRQKSTQELTKVPTP